MNNCLRKAAKQAGKVLIFGVAKTNKQYCTLRKRKSGLVAAGPCGNTFKNAANKCMNRFIDMNLAVITEKDVKKRVPMVCW